MAYRTGVSTSRGLSSLADHVGVSPVPLFDRVLRGGAALEIGCGEGRALLELQQRHPATRCVCLNYAGWKGGWGQGVGGGAQASADAATLRGMGAHYGLSLAADARLPDVRYGDWHNLTGFDDDSAYSLVYSQNALNEGKMHYPRREPAPLLTLAHAPSRRRRAPPRLRWSRTHVHLQPRPGGVALLEHLWRRFFGARARPANRRHDRRTPGQARRPASTSRRRCCGRRAALCRAVRRFCPPPSTSARRAALAGRRSSRRRASRARRRAAPPPSPAGCGGGAVSSSPAASSVSSERGEARVRARRRAYQTATAAGPCSASLLWTDGDGRCDGWRLIPCSPRHGLTA